MSRTISGCAKSSSPAGARGWAPTSRSGGRRCRRIRRCARRSVFRHLLDRSAESFLPGGHALLPLRGLRRPTGAGPGGVRHLPPPRTDVHGDPRRACGTDGGAVGCGGAAGRGGGGPLGSGGGRGRADGRGGRRQRGRSLRCDGRGARRARRGPALGGGTRRVRRGSRGAEGGVGGVAALGSRAAGAVAAPRGAVRGARRERARGPDRGAGRGPPRPRPGGGAGGA